MLVEYISRTNDTDKDYYMMVIDLAGNIHFANSYLITNMGFQLEKKKEHNFFRLLDEGTCESFKKTLLRIHSSRQTGQLEFAAKNRSSRWIKWVISSHGSSAEAKFFCVGYDIAGKKKVRKFHNLATAHYETIMDGLSSGVILQDCFGDVLAANKKTTEIFEVSLESLYDLNSYISLWNQITFQDSPVTFEESPPMKALRSGYIEANLRYNFRTSSGEKKTILINSKPLFEDNQKTPVSVVTTFTDISREDSLETEVHQQQILFETFNDHAPSMSWIVDENAKLLYANKAFFSYLGISKENIGKDILKIVPSFIAKALEQKHRQVLKTGQSLRTEEKIFLANGIEIVFWISLFKIDSLSGKTLIGGEAVNITERFKTEQKLKQVNERLKYLSHITTDAIWEWNIQTGVIYRNKVLQEMIGYTQRSSSSLGWWFRRVHPDDRGRLRDKVRSVLAKKGQTWECEYRFKNARDEYIIVFDRGFCIYENELPVKMIGSMHDISQLKELEEKLVEEKIQHQKNITETIFTVQEKERTRIGHELHDNVNQILGTSKLFLDIMKTATSEDNELKQKVSDYILSAIEEIRRLSKEMVTPQLKEKGLIESVKTIVEDLEATQLINVTFSYDESIEILGSGKKVTFFRIVQEQVKNIIKYSKADHLFIRLYTSSGNAVLEIEDNGVGFDSKQTRRGIGLSNIYERTHFYEGRVSIYTSPGCGCKLAVAVPITN
jgi:PAS domain S-box-containing protein